MRALKVIASAVALFIALPVFIVGILGLIFSPLQTVARATEPRVVLEANDLMLSEAVMEQVNRQLDAEVDGVVEEAGAEDGRLQFPEPVDNDSYEATATEEPAFEAAQYQVGDYGVEDFGIGETSANSIQSSDARGGYYSSDQLRTQGAIDDGGYRYTWYSQRVLPGEGLDVEGRHVTDDGYVADAQGRIVLASSDLSYGTEVDIPFGGGKGVVLDTGCAPGVLDVYTDF